MIHSMTGFASAEQQYNFGRLAWEIRSVNHRYFEFVFRVPEEFRVLEPEIRRILGVHLSRGKVDATLRYTPATAISSSNLNLNRKLAGKLLTLQQELQELSGVEQEPDLQSLLRWPGLVEEQAPDPQPLHEAALELLSKAAKDLQAARGREGEQMSAAIRKRLTGIERWVAQIREWLPEIRAALRQKLLSRVETLQQPLEPGRLEQEIAFLVQKMDVDEELDRLAAHVKETLLVLDRSDPVGRRLDFLMQEFNRESNTLSSKSTDQRTTQAAVELKVLIEQMREQIQNIE
ncbi:MAG: YicC family protein [Proteobacteria bacterium]|nr:YicC family protein [Pseudomonadota bacterium]